ncbi:hypothetical protein V6S67_19330 [Arthrobacter sp. Soc17.1.1.1]|uniref:hypothetical protein n=1 Tax=Arthrobacter sp. Soc17.1.1.1 TaxID=3121277 RepID=UPI002FE4DC86
MTAYRGARFIVAVLVTAFAASGCSTGPTYEILEVPDGPTVMIAPPRDPEEMSQEALLEGALSVGSTGCLGVQASDIGFVPVIFPTGTTVFKDEPLTFTVADEQYTLGDAIAIGGGFTETKPLIEANAYPEKCAAVEVFSAS